MPLPTLYLFIQKQSLLIVLLVGQLKFLNSCSLKGSQHSRGVCYIRVAQWLLFRYIYTNLCIRIIAYAHRALESEKGR